MTERKTLSWAEDDDLIEALEKRLSQGRLLLMHRIVKAVNAKGGGDKGDDGSGGELSV